MQIKCVLKLFVPPVVFKVLARLRPPVEDDRETHVFEVVNEGWDYLDAHPEVRGWNVEGVRDAYTAKWEGFCELVRGQGPLGISHESPVLDNADASSQHIVMVFAYGLALAARRRRSVSFLDWGGGIGHYYVLAQALMPDLEIEYHCKEVDVLAQRGAELLPDQVFYSDERCLDRSYDFVMASASFHYSRDWRGLLNGLAKATASYLLITRLPTTPRGESFVFVQRAYDWDYNTEYLGWCLSPDELLAAAAEAGLTLVREFVLEEVALIQGAGPCPYRAYLFAAQDAGD